MKDTKQGKAALPKPNFKNKDFVKWSRAEICKHEDNIVSTDWHERLKKMEPFAPVYDNKPVNMVYLLSGEYGRIWQKERDEWYAGVFIPSAKQKDMNERQKKIRREVREAKKAALVNAKERKERRAKELEAKAKADAEKAEKLRAKVHKVAASKTAPKLQKKVKEVKSEPSKTVQETGNKQDPCPKGWRPVELTMQCECTENVKDKPESEKKEDKDAEVNHKTEGNHNKPADQQDCFMCEGYIQQLKDIQESQVNETEKTENCEKEKDKEKEKETDRPAHCCQQTVPYFSVPPPSGPGQEDWRRAPQSPNRSHGRSQ